MNVIQLNLVSSGNEKQEYQNRKKSQLNSKCNLANVCRCNSIFLNSYLLITCHVPSFLASERQKNDDMDPALSELISSQERLIFSWYTEGNGHVLQQGLVQSNDALENWVQGGTKPLFANFHGVNISSTASKVPIKKLQFKNWLKNLEY